MTVAHRRLRRGVLYLSLLGLGLAAGVAAGSLRSTVKDGMAKEAERTERQQFLEANLNGIGIGLAFPDIPFTDALTGQKVLVGDRLQNGGAVLYVPHAGPWCRRTIADLCDELDDAGQSPAEAIIITSDPAAGFSCELGDLYPGILFLLDADGAMSRDYGVRTWPVAFYLNAHQVVTRIDAKSTPP